MTQLIDVEAIDEENVKSGDIHAGLHNATNHCIGAITAEELGEARKELFKEVRTILTQANTLHTQKMADLREAMEGKRELALLSNQKHIEEFERDSRAYKANPDKRNLQIMKIHEGGDAGYRGGMIEGKIDTLSEVLSLLDELEK